MEAPIYINYICVVIILAVPVVNSLKSNMGISGGYSTGAATSSFPGSQPYGTGSGSNLGPLSGSDGHSGTSGIGNTLTNNGGGAGGRGSGSPFAMAVGSGNSSPFASAASSSSAGVGMSSGAGPFSGSMTNGGGGSGGQGSGPFTATMGCK